MDFGSILKKGQRKFISKEDKGEWGQCEYCDERLELFEYKDNEKEIWNLCHDCLDLFVKEEE